MIVTEQRIEWGRYAAEGAAAQPSRVDVAPQTPEYHHAERERLTELAKVAYRTAGSQSNPHHNEHVTQGRTYIAERDAHWRALTKLIECPPCAWDGSSPTCRCHPENRRSFGINPPKVASADVAIDYHTKRMSQYQDLHRKSVISMGNAYHGIGQAPDQEAGDHYEATANFYKYYAKYHQQAAYAIYLAQRSTPLPVVSTENLKTLAEVAQAADQRARDAQSAIYFATDRNDQSAICNIDQQAADKAWEAYSAAVTHYHHTAATSARVPISCAHRNTKEVNKCDVSQGGIWRCATYICHPDAR